MLKLFGILKSDAEVEALKSKIEIAIKKAEAQALDAVKLKAQHQANLDELKAKRGKVWPAKPKPATTITDPNTPVPPVTQPVNPSGVTMVCPINVTSNVVFWCEVKNLPKKGEAILYADGFHHHYLIGATRDRTPVSLEKEGYRLLQIKLDGVLVCETNVNVLKNPDYNPQ
jgi:hypothetical protein